MAEKIKRSKFWTLLNTSPGSGSPNWARMGNGITDQTVDYNPESEAETYIHEDSADTQVTGYAPSISTPQTAMKGDEVFEFVDKLRRKRAVLGESTTDICLVYAYASDDDSSYPAEMQKVSVQIDSFGGEGGGTNKIDYTLNFIGDATIGTFDPTTKQFSSGGSSPDPDNLRKNK